MRWTGAAIVVLCASALHSQSPTNTGVVRGRVLAQPSDSAVRNAVVRLESNSGFVATVLSDADGRFVFTNLPSGSYGVSADKAGFVKTAFITRGLPRAESSGQTRFTLAGGAIAEDVDIKLPKAGAISGRILDATGDPIQGAIVTATSADDGRRTVVTSETDDLGEYRLPGLPRGRFIVAITLPPGITGPAMLNPGPGGGPMIHIDVSADIGRPAIPLDRPRYYYPGVPDETRAQAIEVLPAEERSAIDFSIPYSQVGGVHIVINPESRGRNDPLGTTSISGRITRTDGRPIPRAQVRAEQVDSSDVAFGTLTDTDGRYQLNRLRPGRYMVTASKRGHIEVEYGQTRAFDRGEVVRVAAGDKRGNIDISLPRQSAVAGHVLDENGDPVQGARVQVLNVKYEGGRNRLVDARDATKQTNDLGAYRVHDLEPGQYLIRAAVGQIDSLRPMAEIPGYAPTYFPGAAEPAQARFVSVSVSEDLVGLDFPLARVPTVRISGRAVTSNGTPVQGGLTLTPGIRSGAVAVSPVTPRIAADGSFEFPNVPPGEYVIQASMGRRDVESEGEFASQYVLVNGADVAGLVVRTSPGSTVNGRVTFEGDADPPGPREISVTAFAADFDLAPRFGTGPLMAGPPGRESVNANWTFELSGLNGPRRFGLADPQPAGWGLKAIYLNGSDITDASVPLGTPDQSLRGVNVVLTNRLTQVEGIVRDARGQAARNCSVVVFPGDSAQWYPRSRYLGHSSCTRDGAYIVRRLPPGDYFVAAVAGKTDDGADDWQNPALLEALRSKATRVVLIEGDKRALDLVLTNP